MCARCRAAPRGGLDHHRSGIRLRDRQSVRHAASPGLHHSAAGRHSTGVGGAGTRRVDAVIEGHLGDGEGLMSYRRRGLHLAIAAGILLGSTWTVAAPAHAEEACARENQLRAPTSGCLRANRHLAGLDVVARRRRSGGRRRFGSGSAQRPPRGGGAAWRRPSRNGRRAHGHGGARHRCRRDHRSSRGTGVGAGGVAPGVRIVPVRVYEQTDPSKPNAPNVAKTAQGIVEPLTSARGSSQSRSLVRQTPPRSATRCATPTPTARSLWPRRATRSRARRRMPSGTRPTIPRYCR